MDEDEEIRILLEANETILLEAAKDTNTLNSEEIDQLEKLISGLVEENNISQKKENINEHEETLYQLTEIVEKPGITSQGNESNVNILTNQDVTNCSFESILKKKIDSLSSVYKGYNQEVSCTERADDQVNQHILDLMATDPVKYYLSHQKSYTSQLEEEGENESSDDSIKRGRKRKESVESSKVNDTILDLFTNCYTKSLTETTKSLYNDIDGQLNELFLLSTFLGHKLMLPKSETEVQNNPRLSFTSKRFLKRVLNTNPVDNPSRSLSKQQVCSGSHPNTGDSVIGIDHPIPDYDDTIIMMDWWHTPSVNVASLNFSEMFKRSVFDYSNGMHKDIWESKVKRSTVVNSSLEYSDNEQEEHPPIQNYVFPPNQFTALGLRSTLLSRAILERQTRQIDDLKNVCGYSKKEVDEDRSVDGNVSFQADDVIHNVCNQFQDNLITLFTWPHFLSNTNIRTVLLENVKGTPKRQEDMLGNVIGNSGTVLDGCKEGTENGQACSSTNSNCISRKEFVLEENLNQKHQFTIKRDRKMLTEHLVKKRKLDDKLLEAVRKRNPKSQKTPISKCQLLESLAPK